MFQKSPNINPLEDNFEVILHSTRFCHPGIQRNKWREVYGFLIGKLENNHVIVVEAVPMVHGGATEVEFENKHYIEAAEVNGRAAERGLFLVGWYHSHPGLNIFLSSVDIKNHIGYQGLNPKAIALVIDPSKISTTYSGFEIFTLDNPTNLNSTYRKLKWKISGLDEKFVGQMLIDLTHRATVQRPLVEEYGEGTTSLSNKLPNTVTSSESHQSDEATSLALELLEKALSLGEKGEYERAIDLAISSGKQFEEIKREEFATDAFLQIGSILYDFWLKISKIRIAIFTNQREASEDDAQSMIRLAKVLCFTTRLVSSEKIGLILEVKDISGNMVKIEDNKIQIANILIEAAEIYTNLIRNSLKNRNREKEIKCIMETINILSTALIFTRAVRKQKELINQILNINKIISDINFYLIRIQEIKAEENEGMAQYVKAAKLYMGGANKAIEAARSINDPALASNLYGYAEIFLGKSYRSMGEWQKYIKRAPCISAAYYNLACIHFEKSQRSFPVHAIADIKSAENLFKSCLDRMKRAEEECKKLKKQPIDHST
ncbi:MAG: Mov34/MPN/PAD-1 family protein, partial [Candidatus Helarchaeota archaeon]